MENEYTPRPISNLLKDDILTFLCGLPPNNYGHLTTSSLLTEIGTNFDNLSAILDQFQRYGIIKNLGLHRRQISLTVNVEAHDILSKGGFSFLDALSQANLQKLLLELRQLEQQAKPESANLVNSVSSCPYPIW